MTAISSPLSPLSQLEQVLTSVSSLFNSLTESTDSAFRRVTITKKDLNGNLKSYDKQESVIDPVTGQQKMVTKKVSELSYIQDVKTGQIYLDEESYVVATKCALIALGMPFYTLGTMCWQTLRTVVSVSATVFETVSKMADHLSLCRGFQAALVLRAGVLHSANTLGTGLYEIIKAPLFALGCELAALYGIFKPYHGRKFEAMIENAWQHGANFKEDFRKIPPDAQGDCFSECRKDVADTQAYYLAHCFQPRGNTSDARITVVKRENL